jgi:hypothetical protein
MGQGREDGGDSAGLSARDDECLIPKKRGLTLRLPRHLSMGLRAANIPVEGVPP